MRKVLNKNGKTVNTISVVRSRPAAKKQGAHINSKGQVVQPAQPFNPLSKKAAPAASKPLTFAQKVQAVNNMKEQLQARAKQENETALDKAAARIRNMFKRK